MLKIKRINGFIVGHFLLSLATFIGLYGWGIAVQDSGMEAPAIAWLELPVRYFLLQPLAHWVLIAADFEWWTWPGLASLAALFAVNSLIAGGLLAAGLAATKGVTSTRQ